jgi:hypothetical protein
MENDIHNYASRQAPSGVATINRYGTAGLGLDLTAEAWPTLTQVFVSDSKAPTADAPNRPTCQHVPEAQRLSKDFLMKNPVDLLVLGHLSGSSHDEWWDRVKQARIPPALIFEFWNQDLLLSEDGPVSKSVATR